MMEGCKHVKRSEKSSSADQAGMGAVSSGLGAVACLIPWDGVGPHQRTFWTYNGVEMVE